MERTRRQGGRAHVAPQPTAETGLDGPPAPGPETAQGVDRALRAVRLIATAGDGLTVTELAEQLATSRPAVYRLLAALERHGVAARGDDGRARLGLGLASLASNIQPRVRHAALAPLTRLAASTGSTAHLTIADGDDGVALLVIEPPSSEMHVAYRVGARHPLERGAGGRAILAQRRHRLPAGGYVTSSGQLQRGTSGLAAPVPGTPPGLETSVGVIVLGGIDEPATAPAVLLTAREVGAALA